MRGGDPVLEEIEEQNKQPEFIMPDPSIVADEGLYIFHEFKEVLEFCSNDSGNKETHWRTSGFQWLRLLWVVPKTTTLV